MKDKKTVTNTRSSNRLRASELTLKKTKKSNTIQFLSSEDKIFHLKKYFTFD